MKDYCEKVNAPIYKLDVDEKYFRINFFKSKDYLELAGKVGRRVGRRVGRKSKGDS